MMQIKKQVLQIVREFSEDIPDDTSVNLREKGLIDSLAVMNILTSLEEEYSVEIEGQFITKRNFQSVDAMTQLVIGLLNRKE